MGRAYVFLGYLHKSHRRRHVSCDFAGIAAENRAAEADLLHKRITGLARQTCVGLQTVYSLSVDYTTFATRLTDAFRARDRAKATSILEDDVKGEDGLWEVWGIMRVGSSRLPRHFAG